MANETVMVDLTPEALQNRLRRGDVYHPEKVDQALKNFFRGGNLIALRELALRQVAEHVDRSLESYMAAKEIEENWAVRERLAVCISSNPAAQYLIARGARMARRLDAEYYVIYVDAGSDASSERQKSLAANFRFAEDLGAQVLRTKGRNIAEAVAKVVLRSTSPRLFLAVPRKKVCTNSFIFPRFIVSCAKPLPWTFTSLPIRVKMRRWLERSPDLKS